LALSEAEGSVRVGPVRRIGIGFLALSLLLIAYSVVQAVREPWVGDFWEHAAVVREISARPWSPAHPELGIDAPHAFISPYSFLVAGASRLFRVDCVRALGIAGIVNLVLLLAGIRLFMQVLTPSRGARASFYCLLFTLLLWGRRPWVYSGFYDLISIGYVLPYPSAFAGAIALIQLFFWNRWLRTGSPVTVAATVLVAAITVVTHPPTWLFLGLGLGALTWRARSGMRAWTILGLAWLAGLGLAWLWPYYPLAELIFSGQAEFHLSNKYMYERVLMRAFPVLVAVPLVLWGARADRRAPILVMGLGLTLVYAFGRLTGRWNYGRALPFLVFLAHAQLAVSLAEAEVRLAPRWRALVPAATVLACVALSWWWQIQVAIDGLRSQADVRSDLGFLPRVVGPADVVVTDLDTGWYVPAFAGKVVASRHPVAFVPDHDARLEDVRRFFRDSTDLAGRREILARYGARFILIDKEREDRAPSLEALAPLGTPVVDDARWLMIVVRG
jgi:hypothetical protein